MNKNVNLNVTSPKQVCFLDCQQYRFRLMITLTLSASLMHAIPYSPKLICLSALSLLLLLSLELSECHKPNRLDALSMSDGEHNLKILWKLSEKSFTLYFLFHVRVKLAFGIVSLLCGSSVLSLFLPHFSSFILSCCMAYILVSYSKSFSKYIRRINIICVI